MLYPGRMYSGRDHAEVLSALEIAAPRLTKRLRVEFLGEHSTEETKAAVEAARKTVVPSVELRDHPGYVAQEEFDRTLAEADFLILPVSEYLTRNGIIETRGQTCVTGNINDMVRFGLPSLIAGLLSVEQPYRGDDGTVRRHSVPGGSDRHLGEQR